MELNNKIISFLGDSITEGVGVADIENNRYDMRLKKMYNLKEVYNYGIGGTRIAHQNAGGEEYLEHFQKRAERMDKNADAVVVFGGTNDFGHGTAPFGCFESTTVDSFYGAMHNLCKYLMEEYAGKPIRLRFKMRDSKVFSLKFE